MEFSTPSPEFASERDLGGDFPCLITAGIGIWEWASNDQGGEPDVAMACAGDVPTLEILAAVELQHKRFPGLKVRVVDLVKLQPRSKHPHGLSDEDFDVRITDRSFIQIALLAGKSQGFSPS